MRSPRVKCPLAEHDPELGMDRCRHCGKTGMEIFTRIDGHRCAGRDFFSQFTYDDFELDAPEND